MAIESFIYAWMGQESGVTAILGSGDDLRVFPFNTPESIDVFPRLTYQLIENVAYQTLGGRNGHVNTLVQLDTWSKGPGGYSTGRALALAVHGTEASPKLDGYRGTLAGVTVDASKMTIKQDFFERSADQSDEHIYRVMMRFRLFHTE